MIFPSQIFLLLFLPLVLIGWYGLRTLRPRLAWLTAASYVFYGWWDWRFTILLLGTSFVDYYCAVRIGRARKQAKEGSDVASRYWLTISLVSNLGVLAFFKYAGFFAGALNSMTEAVGGGRPLPVMDIALPIGISFYTFQTMSYTIDVYRGRCRPAKDFLHFSAFVSLFPQLVAGPIVRYADLEEQFENLPDKRFSYTAAADGIWLFVIGLVKKVWIADYFAPVAAMAFDQDGAQFFVAWAGALAYTLQLYFDFSGYSDMACGLGKMLGFQFPINFNSPYQARSIADFWQRWHITLSSWLRDYLFIPLGGSRGGLLRTVRNLMIVMVLGGLWHGAAWTFVLWGIYHGVLLAIHAVWRKVDPRRLPALVAIPGTMLFVILGWVLFRAPTVGHAGEIYAAMAGMRGVEPLTHYSQTLGIYLPAIYGTFGGMHGILFIALALACAILAPNSQTCPRPRHVVSAVILSAIMVITITTMQTEAPFLYYQF